MIIKDLKGDELDAAVAQCLDLDVRLAPGVGTMYLIYRDGFVDGMLPKYSTVWNEGGPIIQEMMKNGMEILALDEQYQDRLPIFKATIDRWETVYRGDTVLETGLRCFVAKVIGDEDKLMERLTK